MRKIDFKCEEMYDLLSSSFHKHFDKMETSFEVIEDTGDLFLTLLDSEIEMIGLEDTLDIL